MGQLTRDKPKLLLEINSKTILEYNLEAMPDEIDEVILVVGYMADKIREKFGDTFLGKKLTYVMQKELKGTAHALHSVKDALKDRFLVIMGDDLYKKQDLEKLLSYQMSILVIETKEDDDKAYQTPVTMDDNGKLIDIVERQPAKKGQLVNCGA